MSERWSLVVGYEDFYEVSDRGRVRSLDRVDSMGRVWRGRILKQSTNNKAGHLSVSLAARGVNCKRTVHRLVLEAFVGPCPPGMECCHENGDGGNNLAENLRWDTHRNNEADKRRHGRINRGNRNGGAKLSKADVRCVRLWLSKGYTQRVIARAFDVCQPSISHINTGEKWGWLEGGG